MEITSCKINTKETKQSQQQKKNYIYGYKLFLSLFIVIISSICLIPIGLVVLLIKIIYDILSSLLGIIFQFIFSLAVKYIYISRLGYLHVWLLKPRRNKEGTKKHHSRVTRYDTISKTGDLLSIYTIPCLADNYSYLILHRSVSDTTEQQCFGDTTTQEKYDTTYLPRSRSEQILNASHKTKNSLVYASDDVLESSLSERFTQKKKTFSNFPKTNVNHLLSQTVDQLNINESNKCSTSVSTHHLKNVALNPLMGIIIDASDSDVINEEIAHISKSDYDGRPIHIEAILTTHHHWDHQGGNRGLIKTFGSKTKVYGSYKDHVDCITDYVKHLDIIYFINKSIIINILEVPCHTHGSLMFCMKCAEDIDCIFTGDTLFFGGCGAPFEADLCNMPKNFWQLERHCHPQSLLFPGHEYTLRILWDLFRSPDCPMTSCSNYFALASALFRATHLRNLPFPIPTVPYALSEEKKYNPHFIPAKRLAELLRAILGRKNKSKHNDTSHIKRSIQLPLQHQSYLPMHEKSNLISLSIHNDKNNIKITHVPIDSTNGSNDLLEQNKTLSNLQEQQNQVMMNSLSSSISHQENKGHVSDVLNNNSQIVAPFIPILTKTIPLVLSTSMQTCVTIIPKDISLSQNNSVSSFNPSTADSIQPTQHISQTNSKSYQFLHTPNDTTLVVPFTNNTSHTTSLLIKSNPLESRQNQTILNDDKVMSNPFTQSTIYTESSSCKQHHSHYPSQRSMSHSVPGLLFNEPYENRMSHKQYHQLLIEQQQKNEFLQSDQEIHFSEKTFHVSKTFPFSPFLIVWTDDIKDLVYLLKTNPTPPIIQYVISRFETSFQSHYLANLRYTLPQMISSSQPCFLSSFKRHPTLFEHPVFIENSSVYPSPIPKQQTTVHSPLTVSNHISLESPSVQIESLPVNTPPFNNSCTSTLHHTSQSDPEIHITRQKKRIHSRSPMISIQNMTVALELIVSPNQCGKKSARSLCGVKRWSFRRTKKENIISDAVILKDDFIFLLTHVGSDPFSNTKANDCWDRLTEVYTTTHPLLSNPLHIGNNTVASISSNKSNEQHLNQLYNHHHNQTSDLLSLPISFLASEFGSLSQPLRHSKKKKKKIQIIRSNLQDDVEYGSTDIHHHDDKKSNELEINFPNAATTLDPLYTVEQRRMIINHTSQNLMQCRICREYKL